MKEIKLTFNEWIIKKQLTAEEVEERLNKRKTTGEKTKRVGLSFCKKTYCKRNKVVKKIIK